VRALIDYDAFCGTSTPAGADEVSPAELRASLTAAGAPRLLDVRSAQEWALGHLEGALHVPLPELTDRLRTLDSGSDWVVVCAKGIRSARAAALLREAGFPRVRHLRGGLEAWTREIGSALSTR
jgi:adenylyltransferase/sulfurtransferase